MARRLREGRVAYEAERGALLFVFLFLTGARFSIQAGNNYFRGNGNCFCYSNFRFHFSFAFFFRGLPCYFLFRKNYALQYVHACGVRVGFESPASRRALYSAMNIPGSTFCFPSYGLRLGPARQNTWATSWTEWAGPCRAHIS